MEPTHARKGTWDALIYKSVAGEYGILDLKDKVVLDIGAHIGGFSAMAVGLGAKRVVAYEANPENFALLAANCPGEPFPAVTGRPTVALHHAAVWRSDVPAMSLKWAPSENAQNTGGGGVYEARTQDRCIEVPAIAFDSIIDELDEVDVLKIDCEGSEYPILMTSKLLHRIGLIVGEWHRVPHTLNGVAREDWTPEGLIAYLEAHGFVVEATFSAAAKGRLGHFKAKRPELRWHERTVYSGSGEDGVIEEAFRRILPSYNFAVEFGANDGAWLSNTKNLILHHGWQALLIEGKEDLAAKARQTYADKPVNVVHAKVLPTNIEDLFAAAGVPKDFDFLSIDIDSFDWYVWHEIERYRPKVICIEYNASFPPPEHRIVPYDPGMFEAATARLDGRCDDYFGASLQALVQLGERKGYKLVHCTTDGVNAFFVDEQYADRFPLPGVYDRATALYRLPQYGFDDAGRAPNGRGHDRSDRW